MNFRVLFFAALREQLGDETTIDLEGTTVTVAALLAGLQARGGKWKAALEDESFLKFAVNQELATVDTPLAADDEIAVFPPITGG